jgi:hypothetical protein
VFDHTGTAELVLVAERVEAGDAELSERDTGCVARKSCSWLNWVLVSWF